MRAVEEKATEKLIRSLALLPLTFAVARLAGLLKRDYSKKGRALSLADTTIAAAAIHNGCTLITDNVKDFPMKELRLHSFE